jgi:hypothetical protein
MPWKVAIKLGRVIKPGAIGFVVAPQAWLIHEEASDFFHFSVRAWVRAVQLGHGLRDRRGGAGEKVHLLAERVHPSIDFLASHCALVSAVMFRKTGDTSLDCPVPLDAIVSTADPR